jgi:asparagine synthase (glutamine-hydrolysing)
MTELAAPLGVGLAPQLREVIAQVRAEKLTYLSRDALADLARSVVLAQRSGIRGMLIEAGTARGGSAIVMAAAKRPRRQLRVYDVFGMIPPPTDRDGDDVHRRYATIASGSAVGPGASKYYGYEEDLLGEVTESFRRYQLPVEEHNVALIRGTFEDMLEVDRPVAVAHLDGDWYQSTLTCLERIVPRLSIGGRLVIDDYGAWSGCRTAVDEYFSVDRGCVLEQRSRLHVVRVEPGPDAASA